jgi:[protein-PII] uridylyltransferase
MEENSSTSYDLIFEHINRNLTKIVEDEKSAIEPQNISKSRQASHHQFNTEISYTKLANNLFEFQIITEKQRGLLSLLANEINKNDFSIKNAKINTLGERVEDFFILESDKPNALSNLEQLKTNIHNQIQNVGKKQLQSNPA